MACKLVFKVPRVGEVEAFVHPQRQHMGLGLNFMAQDIAEMLSPRHPAHHGHMRARGLVKMHEDRGDDPCAYARFHAEDQRQQDRHAHGGEIGMAEGPRAFED